MVEAQQNKGRFFLPQAFNSRVRIRLLGCTEKGHQNVCKKSNQNWYGSFHVFYIFRSRILRIRIWIRFVLIRIRRKGWLLLFILNVRVYRAGHAVTLARQSFWIISLLWDLDIFPHFSGHWGFITISRGRYPKAKIMSRAQLWRFIFCIMRQNGSNRFINFC